MAWLYDNAAGDSHASPLTLRITVGGDSDRLLVMQVASHKWLPAAQATPTIMVGLAGSNIASAPTLIIHRKPGLGTADSTYHGLFYFLNPPTGADSISVTLASATQLSLNALSFSRVQQYAPEASTADTWSVTTRGGDSLSITPTSVKALIVDGIQIRNPTATITARSNQAVPGTRRGDSLGLTLGDTSGGPTAYKSIWTWSKTGTRGSHLLAAFTPDYLWGPSGNKVSISGASRGNVELSFSPSGNKVSISGASRGSVELSFNPSGNIVNISGSSPWIASDFSYSFSPSGNIVSTSGSGPWVASDFNYSFDTSGSAVSIGGSAGYSASYNYSFSPSGNIVSVSGAASFVQSSNFVYDTSGNIVLISSASDYEKQSSSYSKEYTGVGFINFSGLSDYTFFIPVAARGEMGRGAGSPADGRPSAWRPAIAPTTIPVTIDDFTKFEKPPEPEKPLPPPPPKPDLTVFRLILEKLQVPSTQKVEISDKIATTLSQVDLQKILDERNKKTFNERLRQEALIKQANTGVMLRKIFESARNEQARAIEAKKRQEEEELLEIILEE